MIQLHEGAAVLTLCAGVVALSARDARAVTGGLLVAAVAAPLASQPAPGALAIALRVVGALLAAYLLLTATRARSVTAAGSALGLPADAALAAAAFCVGLWATPVSPLAGSPIAQAAGVALAVAALVPLTGRDPLRLGAAMVVMVLAFSVLMDVWVGPASPLGQLIWTGLLVGTAGATALLASHVVESKSDVPMAVPARLPVGAPKPADDDTPEPLNSAEPAGKTQRVMRARDGRLRPRGDS